jgi:pre-mRNA-splicing factor ATP-dependent RNA helicase DHX38/PRP16
MVGTITVFPHPATYSLPPAAKTFGLTRDSFLNELHVEISSHSKQEAAGLVPQPVHGIAVHDSEVLEPEPVRQGGLMRKDAVRSITQKVFTANHLTQRHAFRAPAKPIEPPTPRTSVLGLDKLAHQKRLEAAQTDGDRSRKRPRIDGDPVFKGQSHILILYCCVL